jgi:hypothetical protein
MAVGVTIGGVSDFELDLTSWTPLRGGTEAGLGGTSVDIVK